MLANFVFCYLSLLCNKLNPKDYADLYLNDDDSEIALSNDVDVVFSSCFVHGLCNNVIYSYKQHNAPLLQFFKMSANNIYGSQGITIYFPLFKCISKVSIDLFLCGCNIYQIINRV